MAVVYVVRYPRLEDGKLIWCVFDEKHRLDGTPNRSKLTMIKRFEKTFKVDAVEIKNYGTTNTMAEAVMCILKVQGE